MMRPCFIICFVVLIVIPENVRSFFYIPVLDIIQQTGNLTCYLNSDESTITDFQLCAIRVYTTQVSIDESYDVITQNGIWFTNIFRHLIKTRNCLGFSNASDVGVSMCDTMPYETVKKMTLCICATDNCNERLETCEASIGANSNAILLPRSLPVLTKPVECSETSEISDTCSEHASINSELCDVYVRNHSVLCTIVMDDDKMTQKALIEENYEKFLDDKLHELKPIVIANPTNLLEERENYVYYAYHPDATRTVQECACTQTAICNYDISTCAPSVIQTEITTSMQSSLSPIADFTSESTTITPDTSLITESTTNDAMTTDYTTSTSTMTDSIKVDNSTTDYTTVTITATTQPTTNIAIDFTTASSLVTTESITTTIATIDLTTTTSITTQSTTVTFTPIELTTTSSSIILAKIVNNIINSSVESKL
jgi:hypothetical protein